MSGKKAKVVRLQRTTFASDDQPKPGGPALIGGTISAVVCNDLGDGVWLCAYAETPNEQLELEAKLHHRRFKRAIVPAPFKPGA